MWFFGFHESEKTVFKGGSIYSLIDSACYSSDGYNAIKWNSIKTIAPCFFGPPADVIYDLDTFGAEPSSESAHPISVITFDGIRKIGICGEVWSYSA